MFLDIAGEDDTRERQRILEEGIREAEAAAFEERMRPALELVLDDADEHGLSVDEARAVWTAGLGVFLPSREPRTNACCSTIGAHSSLCGGTP